MKEELRKRRLEVKAKAKVYRQRENDLKLKNEEIIKLEEKYRALFLPSKTQTQYSSQESSETEQLKREIVDLKMQKVE